MSARTVEGITDESITDEGITDEGITDGGITDGGITPPPPHTHTHLCAKIEYSYQLCIGLVSFIKPDLCCLFRPSFKGNYAFKSCNEQIM